MCHFQNETSISSIIDHIRVLDPTGVSVGIILDPHKDEFEHGFSFLPAGDPTVA
jgi:hypothetical protein